MALRDYSPLQGVKVGTRLRVTLAGEVADGTVLLASANGFSLMIEFPDRMFAGYVGMMPVLWRWGHYVDLIENRDVGLEKL
jgi:hypothetical protein